MKNLKKSIKFKEISDGDDGRIRVIEDKIPFKIKRVYFIDNLRISSLRGFHAHKELKQVIFCLQGHFDLEFYNGKQSDIFEVSKEGYYIPPKVWHMMRNFSEDCLICVFASDIYKESDYIRSFHAFKQAVK
jgi:mannose-6-phosphate isomerase-like protein (cupin superfamily)